MAETVPFASVAGGLAGRALLVLAVDGSLPGVLLTGALGAGKSTRLASFSAWLRTHDGTTTHRVPLSVDRDRLVGGVDLERTLAEGRKVLSRGLLDEAKGGWVLVDNLHLAEPSNLVLLKQSLESGADIRILAAAPDEEAPWPQMADVLPMHVRVDRTEDLAGYWAAHVSAPAESGTRAEPGWADADRSLAETVRRARVRLQSVAIPDAMRRRLVESALALFVRSPRADVHALRVARAHAALRGAQQIDDEDVTFAITTVLAPRGMTGAQPPSAAPPEPPDAQAAGDGALADRAPDQVFEPAPAALPDLESLIGRARRAVSGRRATRRTMDRGRHLRSRSRSRGRRLAVGETLRRAAVRQASESFPPDAPWGALPPRGDRPVLRVKRDDLCFRELRSRAGTLFIVAVDASGSMAWHRMQEAKGLVGALLEDAYRHRDAVALVTVRGSRAARTLEPTSALARARRELEVLPTGGGTPLASAFEEVLGIARAERHKRDRPVCAIVLTDGRANVPLDPTRSGRTSAAEELGQIATRYRLEGPVTLVVDTSGLASVRDDAQRLAGMLGAAFHRL